MLPTITRRVSCLPYDITEDNGKNNGTLFIIKAKSNNPKHANRDSTEAVLKISNQKHKQLSTMIALKLNVK